MPAVQRARRRLRPGRRCRPGPCATTPGRLACSTGQKVWTSYAQFADWGCAWPAPTPTPPKHRGHLRPRRRHARTEGVEVRPAACRSPARPSSTRCSSTAPSSPTTTWSAPLHDGWRVSQSTLGHERGTNPRQLVIHIQHLEELLRLAVATGALRRAPAAPAAGRGVRRGQAVPAAQLAVAHPPGGGPAAGAGGVRAQAVLVRDVQAPARHGHGRPGRRGAAVAGRRTTRGDGEWQRSWLYYLSSSIFAGTNEIQRTIIGERVLGLPREPKGTA